MSESNYLYSKKILACFYQFERSAIITGTLKFPKPYGTSEIVIIEDLISNQSLSLNKFFDQLKSKRMYGNKITIHVNPNLAEVINKAYYNSKETVVYDFEDEVNGGKSRLSAATDYWKSLKHEERLIENVEIPVNLYHIKMAYLCFLQCAFDTTLNSNSIFWYKTTS